MRAIGQKLRKERTFGCFTPACQWMANISGEFYGLHGCFFTQMFLKAFSTKGFFPFIGTVVASRNLPVISKSVSNNRLTTVIFGAVAVKCQTWADVLKTSLDSKVREWCTNVYRFHGRIFNVFDELQLRAEAHFCAGVCGFEWNLFSSD